MPAGCFCLPTTLSFTAARDLFFRYSFISAGLRSTTVYLDYATTLHFWIPRSTDPAKPTLLLIHGFGANATWQWNDHLRLLLSRFNVYVPDLLFFGESRTAHPERTDAFQAECVAGAMGMLGVERMSLVGVSYGGFVGFRMAEMFPERVEKVVLCCAGVCMEERDLKEGLFVVGDIEEAAGILLPQTPDKLREVMRLSLVKLPRILPTCILTDYINVMCTDYLEEKTELLRGLIKDRTLSDLPKISQPTLIIWGEQDKIFPLELGHRLNRHLEGNSQLVVIKNAGHAVNLEKYKEFCKYIKAFLTESSTNFSSNKKYSTVASSYTYKFKEWLKSLPIGKHFILQVRRSCRPMQEDLDSNPLVET